MVAAEARDPQVGMDGAGNAVAIWIQDGGTGIYTVWASRYSAGVWTAPRVIQSGTTDATGPQVAVDSAGNAVSVWYQQESDTGDYTIRANRYAASAAAWGTPQVIQRGTDDAGFRRCTALQMGSRRRLVSTRRLRCQPNLGKPIFGRGECMERSRACPLETTDALHPRCHWTGPAGRWRYGFRMTAPGYSPPWPPARDSGRSLRRFGPSFAADAVQFFSRQGLARARRMISTFNRHSVIVPSA